MRILFRPDAGAAIGMGHLHRCIALAEAVRRAGGSPLFAVHGDDAAIEHALTAGFHAEPLSDASDASATAGVAEALECRAVVVDSYLTDGAYLQALRDAGLFVVALDDLAEHAFGCQMVVSMGPHAPDMEYQSTTGDTRFLLGPRYTILRPEYWSTPLPPVRPVASNVLVTTGGADPNGVMPSWLHAVDSVDAEFAITAIVGPMFGNPDDVHDAAAACEHTVRVATAPKMLRPMLAAADVVVTAGGQTIYETAALGVPAITVEIAPNQRPQLEAFDRLGAMALAGRAGEAGTEDAIAAHVERLLASPDERTALSERAKSLVNRQGAPLVAAEILAAAPA